MKPNKRVENSCVHRKFSSTWEIPSLYEPPLTTGPFASLKAHLALKNFQLFHFHAGRPILITPGGPIMGKGKITQLQNWMRPRVSSALGIQIGSFASL